MSCLELQGVFIYIPIGLAMVSNLVMFGLCIYKMYQEEEDLFRQFQELQEHEDTDDDIFNGAIETRKNQLAKMTGKIRGRKVFELRK